MINNQLKQEIAKHFTNSKKGVKNLTDKELKKSIVMAVLESNEIPNSEKTNKINELTNLAFTDIPVYEKEKIINISL